MNRLLNRACPIPGLILSILICASAPSPAAPPELSSPPQRNDNSTAPHKFLSTQPALENSHPAHHLHHFDLFAAHTTPINQAILRAIDKVQSTALDGGKYFIGIHATPAESPIGYPLRLYNSPLLDPPRKSSYCSGATYTVFIETLNSLYPNGAEKISSDRLESLRMQEKDGSRREDGVQFWGHWNDDGFGNHFALVQYSGMGEPIDPKNALPGDFVNINWKSGLGHSAIFLSFFTDENGTKRILYFSSQPATNGLGDQSSPLDKITTVKFVRLTHPDRVFDFNPATKVDRKIPGDPLE